MIDLEREEKLKSAKLKLKAFRAKQAGKTNKSPPQLQKQEDPVASTSRASIDLGSRKSRRRSGSRQSQSLIMAGHSPSRRNSAIRHSRTESICNVHSMVQEIAQPASEAFGTWNFPKSPSMPAAGTSPELAGSPFTSNSSRSLQPRRASLQYPPRSPSAGSAVMQASASAKGQRRVSLQHVESPAHASTPYLPTLSENGAAALYTRRNSGHSRTLSIGGGRESLEVMAGQPLPILPSQIDEPEIETDRNSALDVLEGRSPTRSPVQAMIEMPVLIGDASTLFASPTPNRRGSWTSGMTPSSSSNGVAHAGGRGAVDLGMLIEEEEEEPNADLSETHPAASPRRRPQSLFIPSGMTLPSNDTPTTADSYDLLSPTDQPQSSTPTKRGMRPLSLIVSPPSAKTSPLDLTQRPGLRSLTLSSSGTPTSSGARRNTLVSSTSSLPRSKSRTSIGTVTTAAGKRSSISYRPSGTTVRELSPVQGEAGDMDASMERAQLLSRIYTLEQDLSTSLAKHRVLEAENTASQAILKAKEAELSVLHVKMASLQAELQYHGDLGMRVVDLESQLAESSECHTAEIDALREKCNDAIMERDDLKEDVEGWRSRCADLAKAVERERARVEEERKEGAAARDQVRKLGERLAAASSATAAAKATAEEALAEAQAKLIAEMRDQIFSLAGQLERERAAHATTRAHLASPAMQEADDEMQSSAGDHDSEAGSSVTSGSYHEGRRSMNTTADISAASFSTVASDETPPPRPLSFGKSASAPVTMGGLQTLAEEEEEETEPEETAVPQLVPSDPPAHGQGSAGSTCSIISDAMPITPSKEAPLVNEHHRSHSFIKNWKFPTGAIQQVHIMSIEDNSFFGISQAEVLPPLEVDESILTLPPFATSDLVLDPEWGQLGVAPKPVVTSEPLPKPSPAPSPPRVEAAPPVRPPLVKAPSRLSLANFGHFISSYVAPPPAPAPRAKAEEKNDSRRDSLLFAGDQQRSTSSATPTIKVSVRPSRAISPHEAKRPIPSGLSDLDFTTACGCKSSRTFLI